MSLAINSSPASAALPPINQHSHGHKRGAQVESADSSSNDASAAPTGSTQNLFGTLLQTLESVIGLQTSTSTPATAANAASATAAGIPGTASTAAGTPSTQSPSTLLQNYLNNLSHKPQADGTQSRLAGSGISASA